jgi:hypothetical protein
VNARCFFAALVVAAGGIMEASSAMTSQNQEPTSAHSTENRARTEETFTFIARGTVQEVAPLFGADKERLWAPGWNPEFIYPRRAADAPGMVFTVDKGYEDRSVWVNTEFDLPNGRIQYAYTIPHVLLTVITLRLAPKGSDTKVEVKYERTALSPHADAQVQQLAQADRASGPEWEQQLNGYLAKTSR